MRKPAPAARRPKGHIHRWSLESGTVTTYHIDETATTTGYVYWLCRTCGKHVTRKPKDAPD
jgi:hypothetical protein